MSDVKTAKVMRETFKKMGMMRSPYGVDEIFNAYESEIESLESQLSSQISASTRNNHMRIKKLEDKMQEVAEILLELDKHTHPEIELDAVAYDMKLVLNSDK